MPNDFLTSLHSSVIDIVPEKVVVSAVEKKLTAKPRRGRKRKKEGREEDGEVEDDRHRTIGVSMSPKLKERAVTRAEAVGLSFSRYVQWCIEAELDGATLESRFRAKVPSSEEKTGATKPVETKPGEASRGIKGLIQRAGIKEV